MVDGADYRIVLSDPVHLLEICTMATKTPSPVHFFSHGSTAMLGESSKSADYWKKCGDEALANGVKHVVIMVGEIVILFGTLY
jgi:hypothetical protein